ncbi:MAG TPA: flagellar basal body L-ring protein FlgH [Steroidobacteraceae bacterium]|nr:flagellar basal body L-ring protein FlgH [Steroidobacteraceae bacterium]
MNKLVRMIDHFSIRRLVTTSLMLMLSACSMVNDHPQDYAAVYPDEAPETRPVTGGIYQANRDVALFENPIAGRIGDILTIHLVESTTASKKSSTNTKKATNASIGVSNIFGRAPTIHGTNPLSAGMDDSSGFTGEGNSAQSNTLAGDITVTVAKRYSNGNLLIRGQKWLQLNQGQEYVRIQGMVRQADIQPDNTIVSTKVANATISYGGQGALADANAKGWLSRFFDSPLTPF